MIGMKAKIGRIAGIIDAESMQPDGTLLVRMNDHWFPASMVR